MPTPEEIKQDAYAKRLSKHLPPKFDSHALPGTYTRNYHEPNSVPFWRRFGYTCLAAALIVYGCAGFVSNRLWLPGRFTHGATFYGLPAWIAAFALLSGAAGLLSAVLDHYDRRNNESKYVKFQWWSRRLMLAGLVAAPALSTLALFGLL